MVQVDHVNNILGAKVGDTLKIGQLGGNLGTAVIEDIAADSIHLYDVQLAITPPAKLDLTVGFSLTSSQSIAAFDHGYDGAWRTRYCTC